MKKSQGCGAARGVARCDRRRAVRRRVRQTDGPTPPPVTIQILNVSDWHGNLDPFGTPSLGGAWNISARWKQDRASHPTLTLTAGDDFGATPPLSSFFNEEPSVKAQRLMGIRSARSGTTTSTAASPTSSR